LGKTNALQNKISGF
jgi:hypothetical protein